MVLPSGTITMAEVNAEIGNSPTTAITLNDAAVRRVAATATLSPTSPFLTAGTAISMNDLRGRRAAIYASGGTVVDSGGYRLHVFTSPGTFVVSYTFPTANTVEYLVVAGGGGGGNSATSGLKGVGGGGGGAGGVRTGTGFTVSTVSPYPITVGGGGANNVNGSPSIFSTITSTGGGRGGPLTPGAATPGAAGGSGGGGSGGGGGAGAGNTPAVTPPQGNSGGACAPGILGGGGGGGGNAVGQASPTPSGFSGSGGAGDLIPWVPASYGTVNPAGAGRYFAGGGGGGGGNNIDPGAGGLGGGGQGGQFPTVTFPTPNIYQTAGAVNTGGGGGGSRYGVRPGSPNPVAVFTAAAGGSGIVILRYPI